MGWALTVVVGFAAEVALVVVLARHSTTRWEAEARAERARRRREAAAAAAARTRERFRSPLHHASATATATAVRPRRVRRHPAPTAEDLADAPVRTRRLRVPSWPRHAAEAPEPGPPEPEARVGVLSRVRRRRGGSRRGPR